MVNLFVVIMCDVWGTLPRHIPDLPRFLDMSDNHPQLADSVWTVGQDSSHYWSVREKCADFVVDIEREIAKNRIRSFGEIQVAQPEPQP